VVKVIDTGKSEQRGDDPDAPALAADIARQRTSEDRERSRVKRSALETTNLEGWNATPAGLVRRDADRPSTAIKPSWGNDVFDRPHEVRCQNPKCTNVFRVKLKDAAHFCSNKCRQKAYRGRKADRVTANPSEAPSRFFAEAA
jgi:hypothetical protein